MTSFISEDDIEQAIITRLVNDCGYDHLECDPSPDAKDSVDDGTGRATTHECVLPKILRESLIRLNPQIDTEQIDVLVKQMRRDFSGTDMKETNYNLYRQLRDGIQVKVRVKDKEDFDIVRLIDFEHPENNTFTAVNQMWIKGLYNYRRPDVLLFVNGLPLVFIELKNSTVKVNEAYNKNLVSYRKDIPNIFAWNQICVLSNGLETRLGAWAAGYEYYFEWLRVNKENEKIDREALAAHGVSIVTLIDGLFRKDRLIDYVENFIMFDRGNKIIAKNHQYLGVNNLLESVRKREELKGKLGVFWHTQGSGKSYSMVFFVRKVKRKLEGNFTFLVVTDREDLDTQIHKTFVRTEVIGAAEQTQPKNSEQLRKMLQGNQQMVFTLIQKFQYDKTQEYPLLSDRNDIIVLVDEAHRTQYRQLAENMHAGLPKANYIAFTGTPLLGAKRLTNQWFGDYVSEYNFAQAVEDGATVPLFYSRRVPEVGLENDYLDDDVVDIIENENLNDRETEILENSTSRILEVLKREDRLDKVAQDIAYHFPRRGFLGKGMVVSVDKFTAVKMYEKVQHYWQQEKKAIQKERNAATDPLEKERLTNILQYMDSTEMAVVISENGDEIERFAEKNIDFEPHRKKMQEISPEGLDIEDRYKSADDPLRLVFVCAMWLTGFDVPSLSTLYLDKPMKGHTLMQAIARANRVYPGKACGIVVDYVNVFKYMQQALADYAQPASADEYPAKNIDALISNLEKVIEELRKFLLTLGVDIAALVDEDTDTLDLLEELRTIYNKIIDKEDDKERFKVLSNLMCNLYEASKPEVIELRWKNPLFPPLKYIHDLMCNTIDDEKLRKAKLRMAQLLDVSVTAEKAPQKDTEFVVHQGKVIDLSKLDVEGLKREIKQAAYKAVEIEDLKAYLEKALQQMCEKNQTRLQFSVRYRAIIDRYNAGGSENNEYYEKLIKLIEELKQEQGRATEMDLTEEELEIYDLLTQDRKLTKAEEQKVILASKNLYQTIIAQRQEILVVDWYKDEQPRQRVLRVIQLALNKDLPDSYDREVFANKTNLLFNHFVDMAIQGYGWMQA